MVWSLSGNLKGVKTSWTNDVSPPIVTITDPTVRAGDVLVNTRLRIVYRATLVSTDLKWLKFDDLGHTEIRTGTADPVPTGSTDRARGLVTGDWYLNIATGGVWLWNASGSGNWEGAGAVADAAEPRFTLGGGAAAVPDTRQKTFQGTRQADSSTINASVVGDIASVDVQVYTATDEIVLDMVALMNYSFTNTVFYFRVLIDSTPGPWEFVSPGTSATNPPIPYSWRLTGLDVGSHTITVQYYATQNTTYVRAGSRVVAEVWTPPKGAKGDKGDTGAKGFDGNHAPVHDVQFAEAQTKNWLKPNWPEPFMVRVRVLSGGGGGGGANVSAGTNGAAGGGGGAGGGWSERWYSSIDLPASVSMTGGAGGAGGIGATSVSGSVSGTVGSNGGASSFGDLLTVPGGNAGLTNVASGAAQSAALVQNPGNAGASSTTNNPSPGFHAVGGGMGATKTATANGGVVAPLAGAQGGITLDTLKTAAVGGQGSASTAPASVATPGADGWTPTGPTAVPGHGGAGGGAGRLVTAAQALDLTAGGNGGKGGRGSGGGGGGGGSGSNNIANQSGKAGNGGAGGNGIVVVECFKVAVA